MKKTLLLDSSAIINDANFSFQTGFAYATTPRIVSELKDLRSKALIESALHSQLLSILNPKPETIAWLIEKASSMGFQRLSTADLSLLALAIEFRETHKRFELISDDYSIQNFCQLFEIPFDGIIQGKIKKVISYRNVCSNCGKEFPNTAKLKRCDVCDSALKKIR